MLLWFARKSCMQTFLPEPSFYKTFKLLDYRRLGKQRVECKQILLALTQENYGWKNHPATKMWRGHEAALCSYAIVCCSEWKSRGYKDTLLPEFESMLQTLPACGLPPWIGDKRLHDSHKSNLIRKMPEYYWEFWPDIPIDLPYFWPVQ